MSSWQSKIKKIEVELKILNEQHEKKLVMGNELVQNDQQKKLAEQLIKKKYQAWKLLAIGVLLGFTIYALGKLYRSLRTYVEVSNVE